MSLTWSQLPQLSSTSSLAAANGPFNFSIAFQEQFFSSSHFSLTSTKAFVNSQDPISCISTVQGLCNFSSVVLSPGWQVITILINQTVSNLNQTVYVIPNNLEVGILASYFPHYNLVVASAFASVMQATLFPDVGISFLSRLSACNSETTSKSVLDLISNHNPAVLLGPTCSSPALVITPVRKNNNSFIKYSSPNSSHWFFVLLSLLTPSISR